MAPPKKELTKAPSDPYQLGMTYYRKGEYDKATSYFNKALEVSDQRTAEIHARLGWAYFNTKQYDKAAENFLLAKEKGIPVQYNVEQGLANCKKILGKEKYSQIESQVKLKGKVPSMPEQPPDLTLPIVTSKDLELPKPEVAADEKKPLSERSYDAVLSSYVEVGEPGDPAKIGRDIAYIRDVEKKYGGEFADQALDALGDMWNGRGQYAGMAVKDLIKKDPSKLTTQQRELLNNYKTIWNGVIFYTELLQMLPEDKRQLLVETMNLVGKTLDTDAAGRTTVANRVGLLYDLCGTAADSWHQILRDCKKDKYGCPSGDVLQKLQYSTLMLESNWLETVTQDLTDIKNTLSDPSKVAAVRTRIDNDKKAMDGRLRGVEKEVDAAYSEFNKSFSEAELEDNKGIKDKMNDTVETQRGMIQRYYDFHRKMIMAGKSEDEIKDDPRVIKDANGKPVGFKDPLGREMRTDTPMKQAEALTQTIKDTWNSWNPEMKFGWLEMYYGMHADENPAVANAVKAERQKLNDMAQKGASQQEIEAEAASFMGSKLNGVTYDTIGVSKLARETRLSLLVWAESPEAKNRAMSYRVDPRCPATSLPELKDGKLRVYSPSDPEVEERVKNAEKAGKTGRETDPTYVANSMTMAQAVDDRLTAIFGFPYLDVTRAAGLVMLARQQVLEEYTNKNRQINALEQMYTQPGSSFIIAYDKQGNASVYKVPSQIPEDGKLVNVTDARPETLHIFLTGNSEAGRLARESAKTLNYGQPLVMPKKVDSMSARGGGKAQWDIDTSVTLVPVTIPPEGVKGENNIAGGVGLSRQRTFDAAIEGMQPFGTGTKVDMVDLASGVNGPIIGNTHGIEDMHVYIATIHDTRYMQGSNKYMLAGSSEERTNENFNPIAIAALEGIRIQKSERSEQEPETRPEATWLGENSWAKVGVKESSSTYASLATPKNIYYTGNDWKAMNSEGYRAYYESKAKSVNFGELGGPTTALVIPRIDMPDGEIYVKKVKPGEKIIDANTKEQIAVGTNYFEIHRKVMKDGKVVMKDGKAVEEVTTTKTLQITVTEMETRQGKSTAVQTNKPDLELKAYYENIDQYANSKNGAPAGVNGMPAAFFTADGELNPETGVPINEDKIKRVTKDGKEYYEISADSIKADDKKMVALAAKTTVTTKDGIKGEGFAYSTVEVKTPKANSPYATIKYHTFTTEDGNQGFVIDNYVIGNYTAANLSQLWNGNEGQLESRLDGSVWAQDPDTGEWYPTPEFNPTVSGADIRDSIKDQGWRDLGVTDAQLDRLKADLDNKTLTPSEVAQMIYNDTGKNPDVIALLSLIPQGTTVTVDKENKVYEVDVPLLDLFGGKLGYGGQRTETTTTYKGGEGVRKDVNSYPLLAYYHEIGDMLLVSLKTDLTGDYTKVKFTNRRATLGKGIGVSEIYYERQENQEDWGMTFRLGKNFGVAYSSEEGVRLWVGNSWAGLGIPVEGGKVEISIDAAEAYRKFQKWLQKITQNPEGGEGTVVASG